MISLREIKTYHSTLALVCDPKSPFYGKVRLQKILRLPLEDQAKIYAAMNPKLKKVVSEFVKNENKKVFTKL